MINTLFRILWSYMLFWIFCSCGGMVTNRFNTFDDELYQSDWYALPITAQQSMAILIANTQKPATVRGYGNVVCSRKTFQQVSNSLLFLKSTRLKLSKSIIFRTWFFRFLFSLQTIYNGISNFLTLRQFC